jgi:membrane dipeptidase
MIDSIALHASLLTIDTHIDIPWPEGPDFLDHTKRRVDLPKMKRGHMVAGCFAAYVPQGPRTPEGHNAAHARAIGMLERINTMGGDQARVCRSADAIEQAHRDGATIIVPCVENGHALAADVANLAKFAALGARYMTLTHNGHNALADSSNPRADLGDGPTLHGGLSELGRQAIAEMNRLGLMIDIAHVSKDSMLQAAALSRTPVMSTHSCIKALCDNPRNLDDAQLDALRDVGGMINITAVSGFLRAGAKPDQITPSDYVDHIDYAVNRIGLAHVGISSDFDGGGGFSDWQDAADCASMTAELVKRGYDSQAIALLWGGNFLRIMRKAESFAAA